MPTMTEQELHPEFMNENRGIVSVRIMRNMMRVIITIMVCIIFVTAVWLFTGGDQAKSRLPVALAAAAEVFAIFIYLVWVFFGGNKK